MTTTKNVEEEKILAYLKASRDHPKWILGLDRKLARVVDWISWIGAEQWVRSHSGHAPAWRFDKSIKEGYHPGSFQALSFMLILQSWAFMLFFAFHFLLNAKLSMFLGLLTLWLCASTTGREYISCNSLGSLTLNEAAALRSFHIFLIDALVWICSPLVPFSIFKDSELCSDCFSSSMLMWWNSKWAGDWGFLLHWAVKGMIAFALMTSAGLAMRLFARLAVPIARPSNAPILSLSNDPLMGEPPQYTPNDNSDSPPLVDVPNIESLNQFAVTAAEHRASIHKRMRVTTSGRKSARIAENQKKKHQP